jgi:hypothetical protein
LTNKLNNLAPSILRRRVSWFALLPIVLLQLTIAVHQLDHVSEYVDGACHICGQLDRLDAAVDHPAERVPQPSVDLLELEAPRVLLARDAARIFEPRAPPIL